MAINKVEFGDQTLIDLTGDTVTQQDVLNGKTFHSADGVVRSGTASIPSTLDDLTDVSVTSPSNGQVLKYDASNNEWVNGNEGTVEIIPNPVDPPTAQLNSLGFYGTNVVTVLDNGLVSTSSAYAWASYRTALIIGTTYDLKLTDSFYPNDPIYSSFTWQGSTIVLTLGDRKQLTIEETRAGLTYFPGAWRQHYLDIKSQIQSTIYSVGNVTDVEVNGTSVVNQNKVAKITSYKEITRAEYEALPDTKLTDNIAYFITDGSSAKVQGYPPLIYSLEEREVGVWADGKPLYQKTIIYDTLNNNSYQNIVEITTEEVKEINAVFVRSDGKEVIRGDWVSSLFYLVAVAVAADTKTYLMSKRNTSDSNWTTAKLICTLQYTKTTDTAGSGIWNGQGGIAHHYSTNETVVGTWIDGKPVYECTFYVASASLSNKEFSINTGLSNIKKVLTCTGVLTDGSETYMLPFERLTERESIRIFTRANSDSTVALNVITGVGGASVYSTVTDVYVTLTYIKTTD